MSMYNLLEYGKNYSKTSGSLWNCYKDEPNSGTERKINYPIKDSKSFNFKTSITGKLKNNYVTRDIGIVVPLKYISIFWRTPDITLINCGVSLILTSSQNCATTSKA